MAYTDKAEFKIPRHLVQPGGVNIESITTDKTLTYADSTYQIITSGGAGVNDLNLPANKDGAVFWVKTKAASTHNLVVKDADGVTIATLTSSGQTACFLCNGATWIHLLHV